MKPLIIAPKIFLDEDQTVFNSILEDIREKQAQIQSGNAAKLIHQHTIQNMDRQLERIENERSARNLEFRLWNQSVVKIAN